jgi:hypothetical protein
VDDFGKFPDREEAHNV